MKASKISNGLAGVANQFNALRMDASGAGQLFAHSQLGALALPTNASNGQTITLTINGSAVVINLVTSIGTTPNNVLIQGTAALTAQAVVNFLQNPNLTNANQVAAIAANQLLLQNVGFALSGTTITAYSFNNSVNAPLSTFTAATTVTGGSYTANTLKLYVEPGCYYIALTQVKFAGGSTPAFSAPSTNPRIDIVTIDSSGTLAITQGAENASPTPPAYPVNKIVICEVWNVVGETVICDNENQTAGQGYISYDSRGIVQDSGYIGTSSQIAAQTLDGSLMWNLPNIPSGAGLIPSANLPGGVVFGGDGTDGALSISSGTTTVDCGGAAVYVKNYTTVSITGTAKLVFTNPNANGTIVIIKCLNSTGMTLTSSATPNIDVSGMGASGAVVPTLAIGTVTGVGGAGSGYYAGGATFGGGGGGGSSFVAGGIGGAGYNQSSTKGSSGTILDYQTFYTLANANYLYRKELYVIPSAGGGRGGDGGAFSGNGGAGGGGGGAGGQVLVLYKSLTANSGTISTNGGAGGTGSATSAQSMTGGAGGRGGGALIIECAGTWNFTGTIYAKGADGTSVGSGGAGGAGGANMATGSNGTDSGGGGGGGAGGSGGSYFVVKNSFFA